jgi:hypothetical protein
MEVLPAVVAWVPVLVDLPMLIQILPMKESPLKIVKRRAVMVERGLIPEAAVVVWAAMVASTMARAVAA